MRIASPTFQALTHPALLELLAKYRAERGFSVAEIINAKRDFVINYAREWGLDTLIIPVSGGIDSAVVAALACVARDATDSPIKKVIAFFVPQFGAGSSNQEAAEGKVKELCDQLKCEFIKIDATKLITDIDHLFSSHTKSKSDWWKGQVTTYLRTPLWYALAALEMENDRRPIVLGTINLDEGGYLGYFSKSSDAMTDVQLISDLHKSEVRALATELHIPTSIVTAHPNGDMFDNRDDEEVFGASYDAVELYLWFRQLAPTLQAEILNDLPLAAKEEFSVIQANLDRLHTFNRHKYIVPPQGVHACIFPCTIQDGWRLSAYV